jgi:kynurenine formamidase
MPAVPSRLPLYAELPSSDTAPARSAWGVFGEDDEVGTINLLTPERVLRAARLVRKGAVFALNWPLEKPDPDLYGRAPLRHNVYQLEGIGLAETYDNFSPAGSSQWDALNHINHPRFGFYNGRSLADCTGWSTSGHTRRRNGIEHWARRGIAGRGVLLDVARFRASAGRALDPRVTTDITPDDLVHTASAQKTIIEAGDVLLIRTGWMAWYDAQSSPNDRASYTGAPGLSASDEMVAFLWDHHVAAVASDCASLEAFPHPKTENGYLHFKLIPLLGMAIGELFYLEDLARDCLADGVFECFLTAAPLNKEGGVGSPANALAIK